MKKYSKIQSLYKRYVKKGPHSGKFIDGLWSLPEFELLQNMKWEATEKIDGTNIRVEWNGAKVTFGGKTDNAQIPAPLLRRLEEIFTVERFLEPTNLEIPLPPVTIFGEGMGNKIQKAGKEYMPEGGVDFMPFDVWANTTECWWGRAGVLDVARHFNVIPAAIEVDMTLHEAIEYVEAGFDSRRGVGKAEGLVLRAPLGLLNSSGKRVITKVKTKDFARGMVSEAWVLQSEMGTDE